MDDLPNELLEKILGLLRGSDRLSSAMVCRRWAEIVSAPHSMRDICLVLRDTDLKRATPILLDSYRQYQNLIISDGTLFDFHPEFWARIAENLLSLRLENCDLAAGVFYSILQECRKLESLELTGCPSLMMSDALLRPPGHICIAEVEQSLRNVQHLSLRKNRFLTDASFNRMLTLMPNITSLSLAFCSNLQFHPGIFRRFHTDIEFSSAVLTFQNVLACMMRSKQKFVDLDFSGTLINAKALIQIVELYRDSLQCLRLESCDQLTPRAYEAIAECPKLRLLSFHRTSQTNDEHLECILAKSPGLEHLDLGLCQLISSRSLEEIVRLKELRHLNLNACQRINIEAWGSLGALTNLQHLDLSYTDCDVRAFRRLASLKDLRTLGLCRCFNLDSECFVIICENFKRLEKLNLDFNLTLTDEAGVKFHELKYLQSLEITGAVEISDRSLENGIGAPDMKLLSMGLCSLLTDSALVSIAEHHVRLEHLDLSSCVRITDVGLISMVQCLPRLRTLILKNCRGLTDRSLDALQDHCPHLRKLNVEHCSMSGDAIDLLAHQRPTVDIN